MSIAPASEASATGGAPRDEIYPRLASDQIASLERIGRERALRAGEVLFEQGTADAPFYLVLEGAVEVFLPAGPDADRVLAVHHAGEFIGDVDLLAGRATVVSARAREAARVLEVERDHLRAALQRDPELGDVVLRALILRRHELLAQGRGDLVLVGSRHSAATLRLREFLTRNGRPHAYLDVDDDPAVQELLDRHQVGRDDIPVLICGGQRILKRPTFELVAECCGMSRLNAAVVRDLIVIGAGPAGLAAAVYAASEGLDVLVLESVAPGGQAGTSSRIENYLGFPTGLSGQELADRAFAQAEKFGAAVSIARTAAGLGCADRPFRIALTGGQEVQARSVAIASGVQYRKPAIPDLERFEGAGVYYAATPIEAKLCAREAVAIVGGGNSAGQAAVFLGRIASRVDILVRGPGLADSMSRYLIQRIEEAPNIVVRTRTEIVAAEGQRALERVICEEKTTHRRETLEVRHVFVMTGADPHTDWLKEFVALDPKGFIKTGHDLGRDDLDAAHWPLGRAPRHFETSVPHVFAVGDVRAGSVKRVAAAVGEGSACVQLVHQSLAD
jgi:thioredoxin reductase (NADPH)